MPRPPRLIATLLAHAAKTSGAGFSEVAAAIGVNRTTLVQYRSGRRRLSMQAFASILAAYGDDRAIVEAAIHYARVEYHAPNGDALHVAADGLPFLAVEMLRTYVERLPIEAVTTGAGLYLLSADAHTLTLATRFLVGSFEGSRISVCQMRADAGPPAAMRRFALAAPVLIVERIDFIHDSVREIVRERTALVRPLIVTSMQRPETIADPHLRRAVQRATRLMTLDAPSPHSFHGTLPVAAESRSSSPA